MGYLYCRQRIFLPSPFPQTRRCNWKKKAFGRRCSKFTGDRVRYLEESQPHMALQDCLYICISWVTLPVNTMVVCLVEKFVRTVTGSKSYSIGQSDLVPALKRSKYFHIFIFTDSDPLISLYWQASWQVVFHTGEFSDKSVTLQDTDKHLFLVATFLPIVFRQLTKYWTNS